MTRHRTIVIAAALLTAAGGACGMEQDQDRARTGIRVADHAVEAALNLFTYTTQHMASADASADGHLLVAWASRRQEAGTYGVFARLCDPDGVPLTGEIHVNEYMPGAQMAPAVAMLPDGAAWIVWESHGQDGDRGAIIARRFGWVDGEFIALGGEIPINETRLGHQHRPSIAASADGRVLIAWTSDHGGHNAVMGRILDGSGNAITSEFTIADRSPEADWMPAVAAGEDRFVVAWARVDHAGVPLGIHARVLGSDGTTIIEDVVVAHRDGRSHIEPSVDMDAQGRFVVAWMTQADRGYNVAAHRFDASGETIGEPMIVARPGDAWLSGAAVAMADDGRFVVAFNREGQLTVVDGTQRPALPSTVFAQEFDAQGRPSASLRRVNLEDNGRQALAVASNARRVAWGPRERPVFAWEGQTGLDKAGVALTALTPPGDRVLVSGDRRWEAPPMIPADLVHVEPLIPPIFDPHWVPEPWDEQPESGGPDFGFLAHQQTPLTPPDPDLSVGPNSIVGVVNGEIAIFNKQGVASFRQDPNLFWAEVGSQTFVFDPIAQFDPFSQRHVIAATEHVGGNQESFLVVAISKTPDPVTGSDWHKYRWNMTTLTGGGRFIDFPNLGIGPDAIFINTDYFSGSTGNRVQIFAKAPMLVGDPVTPTIVNTGGIRSLAAVTHYDNTAPGQYAATSFSQNNTTLTLEVIRNPLSSPIRSTFNLTVPRYTNPPGAEQQGTSNRVSTVDRRIKHGVYRDGSLWLSHTTGDGPNDSIARVRWYEIAMNGWPTSGQNPALVQVGTNNIGSGVHNWFSDLGVDADGNMVLAFNRSSSSEFVGIARSFRLATDPPGTLREPVQLQTSTSPEQGNRWGDYGGVDADPAEPGIFWSHHEYRTTGWRTWIARIDILGDLPGLEFVFPNGLPTLVDPSGQTTIRVEVTGANGKSPEPGTGVLFADLGDGFEPFTMTEVSPNVYDAGVPASVCLSTVRYYFAAETTEGQTFTSPAGAPDNFHSALSAADIITVFYDNFDTDQGWVAGAPDDDATTGHWSRMPPEQTQTGGEIVQPGFVVDGANCWVTDGRAGNSVGQFDVDNGKTTVFSPIFDLDGQEAIVSYWRWYSNHAGANPFNDIFVVDVSNDGGVTWTNLETVGPSGDEVRGGWLFAEFRLADTIQPTSAVQFRFVASDYDPQALVEACVDAFKIEVIDCGVACPADLNGDGQVDAADFFLYLDWFAAGDARADLNGDGEIDATDFFMYLDLFAQGCD